MNFTFFSPRLLFVPFHLPPKNKKNKMGYILVYPFCVSLQHSACIRPPRVHFLFLLVCHSSILFVLKGFRCSVPQQELQQRVEKNGEE